MGDERGDGSAGAELRERLARLEARVVELERAAERAQRTRARSRMVVLVGVALYLLLLYWEMTKLV